MTLQEQEAVREIIRDELGQLIKSDRFTMYKKLQLLDGRNIIVGTANGTKIADETTQKLGLWGVTPVAQPSTTGTSTGFSAGGGTAVTHTSTFTGATGTTAYTIGDIVNALKKVGIMLV